MANAGGTRGRWQCGKCGLWNDPAESVSECGWCHRQATTPEARQAHFDSMGPNVKCPLDNCNGRVYIVPHLNQRRCNSCGWHERKR